MCVCVRILFLHSNNSMDLRNIQKSDSLYLGLTHRQISNNILTTYAKPRSKTSLVIDYNHYLSLITLNTKFSLNLNGKTLNYSMRNVYCRLLLTFTQ